MNNGFIAAIVILIVVLIGAGAWVLTQPQTNVTNNTTGNNDTNIIDITNNTTNQSTNHTTTNNTTKNITAAEANKLAEKYIAMGVYLGNNTTLTTFKGVRVWNVSVYTTQGLYSDAIYISVTDGKRIE
ncbi:hypothetical protein [Methanobacterium alcaliphilum]|uniref:hypothetical protein n=1 Tax=Methanobacterium alcaliphilum TaxID=392018 RepID=UPI00200B370E|nr:hypothetical protein [Methanobacterium alcaliphilum]MCK9152256.1 hypothetical protein [Methanobacterium alcaliphilum]